VRDHTLSAAARAAWETLSDDDRRAVAAIIVGLKDERVPLVGAGDISIRVGPQGMGRPVPGTDLVVAYLPWGNRVDIVALVRRAPRPSG
jgi:hypothetical protein